MTQHFTKTTVEASVWCLHCCAPTMHYIHGGRTGGCKDCIARLERSAIPETKKQSEQLTIEEIYGTIDIGKS